MDFEKEKNRVFDIIAKQNKWRGGECLNMIASENVMSPVATKAYVSDFMHRYAEGLPHQRYYQGTKFTDDIEDMCNDLAKKLFGADFADNRVISGGVANVCVFSALAKPGELLMGPGTPAGSHISHEKFGAAGVVALNVEHYEFDFERYDIDVEKTVAKIRSLKPKIVTLGGSVIQFPHPVREIRAAADEIGATVVYDGAHVLGLIAGGEFQQPLKEGAHVMTASTHKTFPGPQGGIVLGKGLDEKRQRKIQNRIFPGIVSNHHVHRLPAMAITLLEMMEFGKDYAKQTVKNSKALAGELDRLGMKVLMKERGFTVSHQFIADVRNFGGGTKVADALEECNMIINKNLLAFDDVNNAANPSGIRVGTQELTRFGMKEKEMKQVADLMVRAIGGENKEKVKKEVVELRGRFKEVQYCFKG
ncbi:Serine hydroxymethyltransferase [Candidatus Gugararchaeum adminiculabundum]|nr:Serine hydroxymethyltransferase [Candidatus Gugararchaeum adminiculabundum]